MLDGEPQIGEVLDGRYEVLGELGRGGMAAVYKGRDRRLERDVALKVFHAGFAEAVDPRRTRQEAQMLSGVDHPSVVSMFDASNGAGGSRTYLVMEYVDGYDLGTLLERGPVPADFARRIAADVASALELLHERGIVHRDVKPANILVRAGSDRDASGITAKLTDFGIAQMVDASRITTIGAVVGTAAYLSPEQVKGARVRPASDVYALGLVLLECLTGERAFSGPSTESALARLTRPPSLPPNASPALADLLSRMTALDPSSRPRAAEVAEVLRSTLVGAVTAPETVITAPTPVAGVRGAPVGAGPAAGVGVVDFDSTAPVQQVWDADAELAEFGLVAVDTGGVAANAANAAVDVSATGSTPTGIVSTAARTTRFPLGLAVAASVIAAATVGAILSSVLGFTSPSPDATAAPLAPVSSAPPASSAPVVIVPAAPVVQSSVSPTPTPTGMATPSATPTPSTNATPTPSVVPSAVPSASASPSATPAVPPTTAPSTDPAASTATPPVTTTQ